MVTAAQSRAPARDEEGTRGRHALALPLLAALPAALLPLALYVRTLLPGVGLWDTAEFQAIGPVLGIAHPTGYPSYTLLAWLASIVLQPFGEPALRANLLSALLVAGASGLVAATVALLAQRVVPGIVAGLALAVAPAAWSVALRADPHALHLFMVALLLGLLGGWMVLVRRGAPADRWLLAAAVAYGVSLGNHALTILLAPGIALFVLATAPGLLRRPLFVASCVLALVVAAVALYAYLPIRSAMNPPLDYANPETLDNFSYLVFGEQFRGTFRPLPPFDEAIRLAVDWTLAGLGLVALLALVGVVVAFVRWPALLAMLTAWFVVTWYFSLGYINADIERYYLGPLLAVAVLGGLGAGGLIDGAAGAVRRLAAGCSRGGHAVALSERALQVGLAALAAVIFIGPTLARVTETFARVDQSDNDAAQRWLESVLPQLERDALLISWSSYSTPLWYAQFVEGRRPDVFVVDDRTMLDQQLGSADDVIERYLGQRPVYLIRLDRDLPHYRERYRLEPLPAEPLWSGIVHRVEGRRDNAD